MGDNFIYFDKIHAIAVHDWIIANSGGRSGMENEGLLESPLQMIQNELYYPELEDKLTHLFYSINKNHAFSDGNKRSGIALSAYFLQLNGFGHVVKRFISETENVAVWLADNIIDRDLLRQILCGLIYEEEYSEELKLRILAALEKAERDKEIN
ncbi:type II toxin-antitoxin system death-on-curing family toxin [Janthinobacterium sp. PAMC25594]|jgi:death-on-curing protein|uniref:type II toxin-antitoxin system death-on-curing family toxin n=1 Tax=Janthinobacterium sp. PAMC25594 TaxID=2861284 RepID=UPI001C63118C|nr:type II toxin-antitoxin system death-on-curing family toxin [Janthinobacterium sp. PAMC25594]QYG05073.1 type II toxin-antitoxin system death-on-curing family toxin [Janthinobacterium sp. PAMC25594]